MIKHLKNIWKQPAIMIEENPWVVGLYYGLAVYLVLALIQPFGISNNTFSLKYVYLLGYLAISVLGVALPNYIIPLFVGDYCNEEAWTNGRSFITTSLTIVFISLGNFLYPVVLGWALCSWYLAWISFLQTLLIFVLIYGIKLWLNNKVLKKNLEKAIDLNKHISSVMHNDGRLGTSDSGMPITLSGMGKGATVEINADDLIYVESEKNYCKIVYRQNNCCKDRMLRCTISSIEEQLSNYPQAVRCHRAFIVNIKCICSVEGNSSGYRLLLNGTDCSIPVSRSYSSSVLSMIEATV